MKKGFLFIFVFFLINSSDRRPSYPFITGDGFRALAQHILDEEKTFEPIQVQEKDIIFVGTHFLTDFFCDYFPKIKNSFILITHNSDKSVSNKYANYIDDKKIIKWFAQNVDEWTHSKLVPIPIGLENRYCPYGKFIDQISLFISTHSKNNNRTILAYANFNTATHPERAEIYNQLAKENYIYYTTRKPLCPYLTDVANAIFVLSPRGNGLDCHRTWETLLLGAYPVIKTSSLDPIYQDLPVVIVKNWDELTKKFLEQKLEEFKHKKFNTKKLYFDYWKNLILKSRKQS